VDIWKELQIKETPDVAAIRRAYARRLKQTHPEDDPEGFQTLRSAYETALRFAEFSKYRLNETADNEGADDEDILEPQPVILQNIAAWNSQRLDSRIQHSGASSIIVDSEAEAQGLIRDLMHVLEAKGEKDAAERFETLIQSPALENLETRYYFDDLLLESLCALKPLPLGFTEKTIHILGMDDPGDSFNSDYDSRRAYLLERVTARRAYERLLRTAETKHPLSNKDHLKLNILTSDQVFAAKILTGPFDPRRFRAIALLPWKRHIVLNAIERMRITSPELLQYELNPEIVGWWRNLKESSEKRAAGLKKWGKWVALCSVMGLLFSVLIRDVGARSGKFSQIAFTIGAALAPALCVIFWMLFIRKTAAGRWLSQAVKNIWTPISYRIDPAFTKLIIKIAVCLSIGIVILIFSISAEALRPFGTLISLAVSIWVIKRR
jgi:hypothetical protein